MSALTNILGMLRVHRKKAIAGLIAVILLVAGIAWVRRPKAPEYVTALSARGGLRQTVEAVGTVVSERELELRFAGGGIVDKVFVKEGDRVKPGMPLARLRAGSLAATVAAQRAVLDIELANLRTLEEGTRPEDIAIAEADLAGKRASLHVARETLAGAERNLTESEKKLAVLEQEANVNLAGQVTTSLSTLSEQLTIAENALSTVDDVLSRTDVNDAMTKDRPGAADEIRAQERAAFSAIAGVRTQAAAATQYPTATAALNAGRNAASLSASTLDALFALISALRETSSFDASARETVKASIATQRSKIQGAIDSIVSAQSALQNASAGYDTKIAAERANVVSYTGTRDRAKTDILTYESAVRSAEAQLQLKRAGARQTDVDAARARVRQAQANLARTGADLGDTILKAPIAGTVTHVNIRIGEALPAGAAVTVLGDSPYRIEMFVSEIDIPKVQLTQSGSIELDAFPGQPFALQVGDVDTASTDKDGVPKYRARLDFVSPPAGVKVGMTGDAEIVTGAREDVIHIPRRAVIAEGQGRPIVRVLRGDGSIEERPVTIGMEGEDGEVEVIDGVNENEIVVVLIKE